MNAQLVLSFDPLTCLELSLISNGIVVVLLLSFEMNGKLESRRRRRRPDRGIDLPPSLLHRDMRTELRPLHRLCTLSTELEGTSICSPVILFQRYIAAVSYGGVLKLYCLQEDWMNRPPRNLVLPTWKLELALAETSRVVCLTSMETTVSNDMILGYAIVATGGGHVILIEIDAAGSKPRLAYSIDTNILNVVSVTGWIMENDIHIAVGSKSGLIEEWKVVTSESTNGHQDVSFHLIWRGSFFTSLHSLMAVNTILSACISQKPCMGQGLQSSSVEVLDRSKLALEWKQGDIVTLGDYCVWPQEGCEWIRATVDGSTDNDLTLGSNLMCRVDDSSWAAALADGSVGILHSFPSSASTATISWGVLVESHQATLPYPAIGLGKLDLEGKSHLAWCLRGGTVYCLPMDEVGADEAKPRNGIPTFLPPAEDEEDFSFLHGFAAGDIQLRGDEVTSASTMEKRPVIVYSGDGGIMEVCICGLLRQSNEEIVHRVALRRMVENGTIQMLLDAFRSMNDGARLLKKPAWSQAYQECQTRDANVDAVMANTSNAFSHTRSLLLSLARQLSREDSTYVTNTALSLVS